MRNLIFCLVVGLVVGCATNQTGKQKGSANLFTGGKWNIQEIAGAEVAPVKSGDVPPFVDFIMDEKRLSAFAGCNRMSTGFVISNDTITISQLIATRMACPDMVYEYALEQALVPGSYTFRENGDKLMLFNKDKKVLQLLRAQSIQIK